MQDRVKQGFLLIYPKKNNVPVYHLDALYWQPGWIPSSKDYFDKELIKNLSKDEWIVDGDYGRTLDLRLKHADTIIYLDMPRYLSLYRVLKRRIKYHGKTRPDMNTGCPERLDRNFINWVWNYKKNQRPAILLKLGKLKEGKTVIILKNKLEIKRFTKENINIERE